MPSSATSSRTATPSIPLRAEELSARRHLETAMTMLEEQEREVILLRYGLDGRSPAPCRTLAPSSTSPRERMRQIEGQAPWPSPSSLQWVLIWRVFV